MRGTLRLTGATIHGTLALTGCDLGDPTAAPASPRSRATVDGDVELHRLSAAGGKVNFRAATIGGAFDARDATLHHPDGLTLSLQPGPRPRQRAPGRRIPVHRTP